MSTNKKEERIFVVQLSEYYPNNCSEQEYVEVSSEILDVYKSFDETDKRLQNWNRNHIKNIFFDEKYFGEFLEICTESHEDAVIGKMAVESLVSLCGEAAFRRSIQYYLFKKTLKDIAEKGRRGHNAPKLR